MTATLKLTTRDLSETIFWCTLNGHGHRPWSKEMKPQRTRMAINIYKVSLPVKLNSGHVICCITCDYNFKNANDGHQETENSLQRPM